MSTARTISHRTVREFATALFQAAGVNEDEAAVVSRSLINSNLRGHDSHGVVRVIEYLGQLRDNKLVPGADLEIVSETDAMLVCDARLGFGQVQVARLCDQLINKASRLGIASGTMRNCGHVGRLGEWVESVADQGLAALIAVNDNGVLQCVAPPGGTQPRISTNPIAIGVPLSPSTTAAGHAMKRPDPLVIDMSTSVVANGKINVARLSQQECPEGWLLDANGAATTDPNVRFADPPGSILPLGGEEFGFKGFGLGLMIDLLVGGLSGGLCPPADDGEVECNNVLMIVWSPEMAAGENHFTAEANKLVDYVRSTPTRDGAEIRLPGDRSSQTESERRRDGLPIDSGTWDALTKAAADLGVDVPTESHVDGRGNG